MSIIISIIIFLLAAIIIYAAFIIFYQYTYWKRRGILHLKIAPIIGNNWPIFTRTVSIANHLQNLYNEFPGSKYFGMFDLKIPTILVRDPELIRDVCVKNFDNFIDHTFFVTEEMDPVAGRNLFSLQGQRWKDMRRTLSPCFTKSRMKFLFELLSECAEEFVEYFIQNPEQAKDVEMKDAFFRYTSDVVATTVYGVKVNSLKNRDNEFYLHGKATVSFSLTWIIKFELLRLFPKLMHNIGLTFLPKSTDRFFKNLITDTVLTREKEGIVRQDMIHIMMQAMKKEDNPCKITIDDILAQAIVFFIGGFETSANLMTFVAHELAANPEIQEKLQREIDAYFEKNEITHDSIFELKYLDMVVHETLRLYPPAAMLHRVCVKNCNLPPQMEGYPECEVEKGTIMLISVYGLHRDPKYFPDPERFDPERFSDKNKDSIKPYTYMPFGVGPRICIAGRFAIMEVKLVIIYLLREFVIKFTNKTRHPVVLDKKTFNTCAEGGEWLKLERRKKLD